jgi:hypothetical protein
VRTPVILATQEYQGSKPAWANSSQDPISKIPNTKRASGVAQGVGPEFKLWYHKNKNKPKKPFCFQSVSNFEILDKGYFFVCLFLGLVLGTRA